MRNKDKNVINSICFRSLLMILLIHLNSFAQKEANHWYFGSYAGLDFSGGAPVSDNNGLLDINEGCAAMSDASGNLLFYTDGVTVYDRNHIPMSNGFGLYGHISSNQSAVIIQKPGSATMYYIFTADAQGGPNGINYSEVDMQMNGGLGDITINKNIFLNGPSSEKLTVIKHCNGRDIWVITHDLDSDAFRTYLVTGAGVNPLPVISNVGYVFSGFGISNAHGSLIGSPNGEKLASTSYQFQTVELFDFDKTAGIVSNPIQLLPNMEVYGIEFSPDGSKFYTSDMNFYGKIYQYDLCAGSDVAIANSSIVIGNTSSQFSGDLMLGPDKKIYAARFSGTWLGVIDNPNTLGVGCNYIDNGVSLNGATCYLGLPNFASFYFKELPPPFTVAINCVTANFTAPTVNITNCSGSTNAINTVSWNFGDVASGINNTSTLTNPSHVYSSVGTYSVTLVLNYTCGNDTIVQNITTISCPPTVSVASINVLCYGQCTGSAIATVSNGASPYTYSWNTSPIQNSQTATGLCAGSYTVTVTDALTSTTTAVFTITESALITTSTSSTGVNCTANDGTASVTVLGGTPPYTYSWLPSGGASSTASGLGVGSYTVTVTDNVGCTQTAIEIVNAAPNTLSITTTSSLATCLANDGTASANVIGGAPGYTYLWSPSGGVNSSATGLSGGTYTVTVTDINGCTQTATTVVAISNGTLAVNTTTTATLCTSNNGSATVNVIGGTPGYTYLWSPSGGVNSTAIGLSGGTYTITVTDINGCTQTATALVAISNGTLVVTTTSTDEYCASSNGTATANFTGGTPGYSYLWSPNGGVTSFATGLSGGTYTVVVTDANGCTQTSTVLVNSVPLPTVTTSSNVTIQIGTSTTLNAVGGVSYVWSPSLGLNCINCQSPVANPLQTTIYCVVVTDNNGCIDSACVTVTVEIPCPTKESLKTPNAFSPNLDNVNDEFCLQGWDACIESFTIYIFDRWGEKVFESKDPNFCWDGKYKGKLMDPAVFVYFINATYKNNTTAVTKKGNISLIK